MQTKVGFKGRKDGLELQVRDYRDFEEFIDLVEKKLKIMGDFLKNSQMKIQVFIACDHEFTPAQNDSIRKLLEAYCLAYAGKQEQKIIEKPALTAPPKETKPPAPEINFGLPQEQIKEKDNCLLVFKTLRSGQSVSYHLGSVIVIGDVNPGAKIAAAGDIIISGWTRGELHAGVLGEETAQIITKKLKGGQLRIASAIAVADNADSGKTAGLEKAFVEDGSIVIDSI